MDHTGSVTTPRQHQPPVGGFFPHSHSDIPCGLRLQLAPRVPFVARTCRVPLRHAGDRKRSDGARMGYEGLRGVLIRDEHI